MDAERLGVRGYRYERKPEVVYEQMPLVRRLRPTRIIPFSLLPGPSTDSGQAMRERGVYGKADFYG